MFVMIYAQPFVRTNAQKLLNSIHWLLIKSTIFIFSLVIMAANYAKINGVDKLEAGFPFSNP